MKLGFGLRLLVQIGYAMQGAYLLSEPYKVRLVVFDTIRRNQVGPCEQFAENKTKKDIFVVERSEIPRSDIGSSWSTV